MPTLDVDIESKAVEVAVTNEHVTVRLSDGRLLSVPTHWYPRLMYGTSRERARYDIFADGQAIEWPLLDEHIGLEALFAGRKSQESHASLEKWLEERDTTYTNRSC